MSGLARVVVTGHAFRDLDIEREVLRGVAEVIETQPVGTSEVVRAARDADGILNQGSQIDADVIRALTSCKVIVPYGIGTDKIAIDAATEAGIQVCNVPTYCIEEVATHAIALLLGFEREIARSMARMQAGHYDHPRRGSMRRLSGRTLGLLGFGRIGRRVAELARPFGLELLAHDPFADAAQPAGAGVRIVGRDELLARSHYVSVHCPLTPQTRGLIDAAFLAQLRPDAVLVNVSRGKIVVEAALVEALRAGRIRGAALDVFETEPLAPGGPLLSLDNVVLTPHTAWYSDESEEQLKREAASEVRRVLLGEAPRHPVNRPVRAA